MQSSIATLAFNGNRHCFITLPRTLSVTLPRDKTVAVKLENTKGSCLYATWNGSVSVEERNSGDLVEINGLFGNKQGLSDGDEVVVTVLPSMPLCTQLSLEPVSPDDWEILEIHAAYVENNLLNQLRVVWEGQTFPVWIQRSICIFVKISKINPDGECSLLEQNSEVIVAPKLRMGSGHSRGQSTPANVSSDAQTKPGKTSAEESSPTASGVEEGQGQSKSSPDSVLSPDHLTEVKPESMKSEKKSMFDRTLSLMKNLWYGDPFKDDDERKKERYDDVTTAEYLADGHNVDCFLRTVPLEDFHHGVLDKDLHSSSSCIQLSAQPTNVYTSFQTFLANNSPNSSDNPPPHIPSSFLATIQKLPSPNENREQAKKDEGKMRGRAKSRSNTDDEALTAEPETASSSLCVVRVIVLHSHGNAYIHRDRNVDGETRSQCVAEARFDKWLAAGQIVVHESLRQQMALDATGRIRLKSLKPNSVEHCQIASVELEPFSLQPVDFSAEMLEVAFRSWLSISTSLLCPLIASHTTFVSCPVKPDEDVSFIVRIKPSLGSASPDKRATHAPATCLFFLHPECLRTISCTVKEPLLPGSTLTAIQSGLILNIRQLDPELPAISLKQLGGVEEESQRALEHVDKCLAQRPLIQEIQKDLGGLHMGGVLLTGGHGLGKSALSRALCRAAAAYPHFAYVATIDCKTLRGKRIESVRRYMEQILNEASWREPAAILLDDLDLIAASPSGPEQEMSGEAVYFAKVAELFKDLFKCELESGSRICILATAKSRSALHPALVAPSGHHFFQEVIELKPPNQEDRIRILEAALSNKTIVALGDIKELDLVTVARSCEGFVARDLDTLVSRAMHHHVMKEASDAGGKEVHLTDGDFTAALQGFTPMALRNVPLHQGGLAGWESVGGLHEVRNTLVQTLQWPSKYPELFSSCPLRLRSGLLLYGAPGTGKTLLAAVVAKECHLNFISIKGPELLSKYIGASEQAVRDTFHRAQSAKPCILFFDEFDSLAPRRGHDSTGVTDRVVNQLLTQLDGVEGLEGVYVLAATSRPDLIDPALLRPGRFDKALHCPLPNQDERLEILKALTRNMSISDDVDLKQLADETDHFTGADFKALLYNAQLEAIHGHTTTLLSGDKVPDPVVEKKLQEIQMTYIPNPEEGVQSEFDADHLQQLLQEVSRVLPWSNPQAADDGVAKDNTPHILVNHKHLNVALATTRPSVSETERFKYHRIYQSFVASRGGTFTDSMATVGKRATLA